ncbi:hypothetical protein Tco_1470481 [Tanacetum coccineum]
MMQIMSMLVRLKDKDLKISNEKKKSKDNDKGSRSKIAKHEGTSLQHELLEITGSTELHKRMRFWFVQEISKEEGLLKFLHDRCDDLRRKNAKRRVLIHEMEALGEHGVAVDSLESLKQTHARETAKLSALTYAVRNTKIQGKYQSLHR